MAEQLVIELTREKETPGTVRFQESMGSASGDIAASAVECWNAA